MTFWEALPAPAPISLGDTIGWIPAVAVQLVLFALIVRWTRFIDRQRTPGAARPAAPSAPALARLLHGPWPLLAGAVALAVVNVLTLVVSGQPWGITWAFTLVGAKAVQALGVDLSQVPFWNAEFQQSALAAPLLADVIVVMDVGLVLGALLGAGLAGRFAPARRIPPRVVAASLIGGLLLGYGSRIAFGCNIGAYFSGIASTSLHGWFWALAALLGTPIGVKLRVAFGLDAKKSGTL